MKEPVWPDAWKNHPIFGKSSQNCRQTEEAQTYKSKFNFEVWNINTQPFWDQKIPTTIVLKQRIEVKMWKYAVIKISPKCSNFGRGATLFFQKVPLGFKS